MSIIPQEPTLFEGTLRNNLDPLEEHSDFEIWEVIRFPRLLLDVTIVNAMSWMHFELLLPEVTFT